jgi:hypothetical protein
MTAAVEEVAPWSRLRWAATISFVVGIQLVLVLAFSNPPGTQPRQAPAAQVTSPSRIPPCWRWAGLKASPPSG